MREILFRGKEADNEYGLWVEGNLAYDDIINVYENYEWVEHYVLPQTVCQYTGLTDKNGKKIFEGDIVKAIYKSNYIGLPDTDFGVGVIKYDDTYYGGASYKINIIGDIGARIFSSNVEVEVIGNIYDNPELLGGTE